MSQRHERLLPGGEAGRAAGTRETGRRQPGAAFCFHGGKGGVGVTTLAAEAAFALSAAGRRVVALDLDTYRGDLNYRLDQPISREAHTVADLLPVIDELDGRILENALSVCPCGVRLLPSPRGGADAALVDGDLVSRLVPALASEFEYVLIDTPPRLDTATVAALTLADAVVLVATPEVACIGGARGALEGMDRLRENDSNTVIVLNRSLGGDLVTLRDVESFLGRPVALVLPEETARCRVLGDEGKPVASGRSALSRGISVLMHKLFDCLDCL